MEHNIKPWGQCWILENNSNHIIRRISVNPGGYLSYQCQDHRDIWILISAGECHITTEGIVKKFKEGESAIIPKGVKHCIENSLNAPLIFIEVQHGFYHGNEDIVRIDDFKSA